jgi:hypothetical protein
MGVIASGLVAFVKGQLSAAIMKGGGKYQDALGVVHAREAKDACSKMRERMNKNKAESDSPYSGKNHTDDEVHLLSDVRGQSVRLALDQLVAAAEQ